MDINNSTQPNEPIQLQKPVAKKTLSKRLISLIILAIIILITGLVFFIFNSLNKKTDDKGQESENKKTETENNAKEIPALIRYGSIKLVLDKSAAKVNEEINAQILMDTQNSNIVVGSALVQYDQLLLKLISIDDKKSVLTMSIMKKDNAGLVEIVRGIPGNANPDDFGNGYNGKDGLLASLKFKALKTGPVEIKLLSEKTKLILDDGRGTEMRIKIE